MTRIRETLPALELHRPNRDTTGGITHRLTAPGSSCALETARSMTSGCSGIPEMETGVSIHHLHRFGTKTSKLAHTVASNLTDHVWTIKELIEREGEK